MAKTNMIEREKKRAKIVKKYATRRKELKAIVLSPKSSYDEKMAAQTKLQKLPRDASPTRQRNRCALTGRSRGVYRKFALGRHKLRERRCAATCRVCARPAGKENSEWAPAQKGGGVLPVRATARPAKRATSQG
jgi:small subunit ribosomal protein S14